MSIATRTMKIETIYLDDRPNGGLIVGDRLRQVDDEKVRVLADSMAKIGLQQPISVWVEPEDEHGLCGDVHLVAGLHRLRAAVMLGWDSIPAIEVDLNDIDRRRWEISENLHRSELTVLQRDEHIAEWIRLTEESESAKPVQVAPVSKGGRGNKGGINAAARELNIETTDAKRAVKVASLSDEAKEVAREVHLDDNRSALLEAAKAPKEKQAEAIREIAERKQAKTSTAAPVDHHHDGDAAVAMLEDRPHRWGDPTKHYRWSTAPESVKTFVDAVQKKHKQQGGNTKMFMLFYAMDLLDLEDEFMQRLAYWHTKPDGKVQK